MSHYLLSLSGASSARLMLRLCAKDQDHVGLQAIATVTHSEKDLQHYGLAHWLRVSLNIVAEVPPDGLEG